MTVLFSATHEAGDWSEWDYHTALAAFSIAADAGLAPRMSYSWMRRLPSSRMRRQFSTPNRANGRR